MKRQKNKNRDSNGTSDFDGFILDERTQQSTKNQSKRWRIISRYSMQGDDDRGGSYRVFSAIGFQDKKIGITKIVVALGGRQLKTARNNQPHLCWIDGGVLGED